MRRPKEERQSSVNVPQDQSSAHVKLWKLWKMELGLVEDYAKKVRLYSLGNSESTEFRSGMWMIRSIF